MKTRGWLVAAILCTLTSFSGMSQCGTIHTITYDTTITGVGINDDPYTFTFPKFNPSLGTLSDVNLNTQLTLDYNYNAENTNSTANTFRLKVTRYDDIFSSAFSGSMSYQHTFPNSLAAQTPANYYTHALAASDPTTGSGPDYAQSSLTLLNNSSIISGALNPANFSGSGNVSFDYYTYTSGSFGAGFQFNSTVTDQITFSITYTYCDNIILNSVNNPRITRTVERQGKQNKLFPNPSINGNFSLQFHNSVRGDWQVEVFNSGGQMITQKKFNNTLRADINNANLSKGIYIIKATNLRSRESFTERLLVK